MTHVFVDKIRKYQEVLKSTSIYVVDVETTLISKDKYKTVYNTPPKYVCHGWVSAVAQKDVVNIEWDHSDLYYIVDSIITDQIYVGHNISYDIFIASTFGNTHSKSLFIWDTMLAEYLLTNQIARMPSLEQCCENHGIAMRKDEEVAQMMKAGICPSTIPKDKLEEYLKGDLLMTKEVFKKQREQFYNHPPEWQVMFINQMFFLVNTLRASCNGMKIDWGFVADNKTTLEAAVATYEADLKKFMGDKTSTDPSIWNPASNLDLSVFLYGGTKKWDERVANGVYKTGIKAGQTKYKIEKKEYHNGVMFSDRGSVDESALKSLINGAGPCTKEYKDFVEKLIEYKDTNKNLNTYFEGYMNHATVDGFIKPKYNHGLTPTGRLTCSGPNLQNIKG